MNVIKLVMYDSHFENFELSYISEVFKNFIICYTNEKAPFHYLDGWKHFIPIPSRDIFYWIA